MMQGDKSCCQDAGPEDNGSDAENSQSSAGKSTESSFFSNIRKDFIFLLLLAFLVFIVYSSPFKHYLDRIPDLCRSFQQMGIFAPVLFTFTVCLLVCAGVPRLLLCPVGGMAFGFFTGLICCVIGTLMSSYVIFLFVRWGGRRFVLRHVKGLDRFPKMLENGGIPAVILVRMMPLHGMIIDTVLGLSKVRHRDFIAGTLIGFLPEAIPFTLVGEGVRQEDIVRNMIYIMLAFSALAAAWFCVKIYLRRRKNAGDGI